MIVLFSIWDQGCDQDKNRDCDPDTLARLVSCGAGVTCEGFGGEGTGKKSWFSFNNWSTRTHYYMVTHARSVSATRTQVAGYFHADTFGWRHLATFEISTDDWDLDRLHSFVEQLWHQDTDQRRSALFGPSFVSNYVSGAGEPVFAQLPYATFVHGIIENHMHVNAWADEAGAVGIQVSTGVQTDPLRTPRESLLNTSASVFTSPGPNLRKITL